VGNSAEVTFLDAADSNNACFNEVLQRKVINTSGAKDNVSTSSNNFLAAFLADIHFALTD